MDYYNFLCMIMLLKYKVQTSIRTIFIISNMSASLAPIYRTKQESSDTSLRRFS